MLKKMELKGVVSHAVAGRRFIYEPAVSEGEVKRSMVGQLTEPSIALLKLGVKCFSGFTDRIRTMHVDRYQADMKRCN